MRAKAAVSGLTDQKPDQRPWYRADVQGLRAVAVLGVVIFHAGLPLKGGYTGVDVFFVISGFVIGGLLLRELEATSRFSPRSFYLRRARRILPAAAAMTLATLVLSSVLLSPLSDAQQAAGRAGAAASIFLANAYFFLFSGGYFEPTAASNPFLHTWSLSVEEQFYFVLPWLLIGGWLLVERRRLRAVTILVALGWILSMTSNLVFTYQLVPADLPIVGPAFAEYPEMATAFAFFSPVTRSWEFLTGVLVLLIAKRVPIGRVTGNTLAFLGMAAIAISYVTISENAAFPGVLALVPVLGAAAILLAGYSSRTPGVSRVLGATPMRHVGDLSYSW